MNTCNSISRRGRKSTRDFLGLILGIPMDGHKWLKYGQKIMAHNGKQRYYHKCSMHKFSGCQAKRIIEFPQENPFEYKIFISSQHNHSPKYPRDPSLPSKVCGVTDMAADDKKVSNVPLQENLGVESCDKAHCSNSKMKDLTVDLREVKWHLDPSWLASTTGHNERPSEGSMECLASSNSPDEVNSESPLWENGETEDPCCDMGSDQYGSDNFWMICLQQSYRAEFNLSEILSSTSCQVLHRQSERNDMDVFRERKTVADIYSNDLAPLPPNRPTEEYICTPAGTFFTGLKK